MGFRVVREGISWILNGFVGFLFFLFVKVVNGIWFLWKLGMIMILVFFGKLVIGVIIIMK